jgi:hypothetical protein
MQKIPLFLLLTPPLGGSAATVVAAAVGALSYLAKSLIDHAPAGYSKSNEFISLLKVVEKSVGDLQTALFAQDQAAVKEALRQGAKLVEVDVRF